MSEQRRSADDQPIGKERLDAPGVWGTTAFHCNCKPLASQCRQSVKLTGTGNEFMKNNELSRLISHVIDGAKTNPRMARGLRDLIKNAIDEQEPGSEAHSHLLETLNSLDNFVANQGDGYSKDRVMPKATT